MPVKAVIFDLDGTLLDTLDDLTAAVNYALSELNLGALDKARVRRYVGNGVPKLIERALYYAATGREPVLSEKNETDAALFLRCLNLFTEYYDAHSMDKTVPYDGVCDMLETLKRCGIKTAIVTNKYDHAAQALKVRFFRTVDIVVGAREDIRPKPAPDGVLFALGSLGTAKEHAVYVGDGETDIQTAKACGMPVVAVTWGFRDRAVLQELGPDAIIDSPSELLSVDFISGELYD